ncbi:MAG: class I poly(R)-hydroxyalkanoic acid synthase [Beijerinckiaceae bacterium]|jgi:polyhydroxyalkanoate synthase
MTSSAPRDEAAPATNPAAANPVPANPIPANPEPQVSALGGFPLGAIPLEGMSLNAPPMGVLPVGGAPIPPPNIERLATNAARFIEQSGKALAAYLKPFEEGEAAKTGSSDSITAAVSSIGRVAEYWMGDPARAAEAQAAIAGPFMQLWMQTYQRLQGAQIDPVVPVAKGDKRFASPDWKDSPLFDFLRQAHSISAAWAEDLAERSDDLDPSTKAKAKFYLRQITSALSPANFVVTNPELLRETLTSSGDNLVRGATLLAEDIEAGHGHLRIRQTDGSKFELGVNVATTPGKVVFRNEIFELIQYAPTTGTVLKRPLLIVPPWINKFYILDLNPGKSFVRWAVAQGLTVFVMSWVNPGEGHRETTFEDYITKGLFKALDAIEAATGEKTVNAAGYCVGGTMLATALAYMAEIGDTRIASATFFAAQTDFTDPGEINVFIDDLQVKSLEATMTGPGYLDGSKMAAAFNMLRPNDLIWAYVIDNYMKGKAPPAFDLLSWNSDSTRLPALNHSFYLRNFYMENKLAKGELEIGGKKLSLAKVKISVYSVATREDHIAPAASVFRGAKLFGGPMRYVLGGSGHIAGIINPPSEKPKYGYATGPRPFGTLDDWQKQAEQQPGSWWPDWLAWLWAQAPERVLPRTPGDGKLAPITDAPGDYVRVKS